VPLPHVSWTMGGEPRQLGACKLQPEMGKLRRRAPVT